MKQFKNILVGVDLAWGDRLVSDRVGEPSQQAIDTSIALAKTTGAKLCFVYSLDVDASTERMIEEQTDEESNVVDQADKVLGKIVAKAEESGITATARVIIGRSWIKLIQEVQNRGQDLVIVGTREAGAMKRILMGTTAMRLLRRCPCPVLVTKPGHEILKSVLAAHDMTKVGSMTAELASSIAELTGAQLHVLHSVENVEYADLRRDVVLKHHDEIRMQIEADISGHEASIHLTDESPWEATLGAIEKYDVDILVMGTITRSGFSGLLIGNTAERILPQLTCSVLAVKPEGFESGVE